MTQPNGNLIAETRARPLTPAPQRAQTARAFLALTKPLQTLLLLVTGLCAYALSRPRAVAWGELLAAALALTGAIAGCTVLNMVLDRDIDARMGRTTRRPLPAGRVSVRDALIFGLVLSIPGLALSWALSPLFGLIVTLGFAIDLGVYTLWLSAGRPSPFSSAVSPAACLRWPGGRWPWGGWTWWASCWPPECSSGFRPTS
jgi:heme O synthase-like polyprenyltransferase